MQNQDRKSTMRLLPGDPNSRCIDFSGSSTHKKAKDCERACHYGMGRKAEEDDGMAQERQNRQSNVG